jgi:hypothetical protein
VTASEVREARRDRQARTAALNAIEAHQRIDAMADQIDAVPAVGRARLKTVIFIAGQPTGEAPITRPARRSLERWPGPTALSSNCSQIARSTLGGHLARYANLALAARPLYLG